MIRRLAQFFAAQKFVTLPLWILCLGFGLTAYTTLMPREGFPSVEVPLAIVSGGYFVDDQVQVDTDVAQPIGEVIGSIAEVDTVSTNARDSSFVAIVSFDSEVETQAGVELLEAELASLDLPDEAVYQVEAIAPALLLNRFDLLLGVTGPPDATAASLEEAAAAVIPVLEEQGAITGAEVVELLRSGVNPATGEEVVTESAFNQATLEVDDALEIRPAVTVGVLAGEDVDALGLSEAAEEAIAQLGSDSLPDGYEAFVAVDFATQIRSQIGSLQRNVLTGLIAVSIIALLMISWRASIITAIFIVTVLATSVGVLYLMGISLNTISLFGIILALGLFVDDAIVITEAIDAFRDRDGSVIAGIGQAIQRVGAASVSGTITTVLVFAPMLAISGILGEFIRVLPIAVIVALVTSLILSLIFIPFAARYLVLSAPPGEGPVARAVDRLAALVASMPAAAGRRSLVYIVGAFALSLGMTAVGLLVFAPRVGFNIFPQQKDAEAFTVNYSFDPGTSIGDARSIALATNQQIAAELGDDFVDAYTFEGGVGSATTQITVSDIGSRDQLPQIIDERLVPLAEAVEGARVTVQMNSSGPPESEFPFQMQVYSEDPEVLVSAGQELSAALDGATISRLNGTTFNVVETTVALSDVVAREDGRRLVEVRARFDADDVSSITTRTRDFIEERYPEAALAELGLEADALGFDFGLESENQESFDSMGIAFAIAMVAMLVLLVFQFRSSLQWLLVFLAIPFSFFGVFGGLLLTDNPISFFVMLGILGLLGIAVNNTILLTDFANQERRAGATRSEAIEAAVRRRFRPLLATSLTTVAGLLPLALSDPFWESLGFTIVFGLLSSTFLVLLAFPAYYLVIEAIRDAIRTPWRYKIDPDGGSGSGGGGGGIDGPSASPNGSGDGVKAIEVMEQASESQPVTV